MKEKDVEYFKTVSFEEFKAFISEYDFFEDEENALIKSARHELIMCYISVHFLFGSAEVELMKRGNEDELELYIRRIEQFWAESETAFFEYASNRMMLLYIELHGPVSADKKRWAAFESAIQRRGYANEKDALEERRHKWRHK